jgi:hypothetical protein
MRTLREMEQRTRANNDEDIVGQVRFVSKTRAELTSNYDSLIYKRFVSHVKVQYQSNKCLDESSNNYDTTTSYGRDNCHCHVCRERRFDTGGRGKE